MHWSVRLCVGDVTISRANSQFVWDSCIAAVDDRSVNLAYLIFTCSVKHCKHYIYASNTVLQ